jgi:hypothetical protein
MPRKKAKKPPPLKVGDLVKRKKKPQIIGTIKKAVGDCVWKVEFNYSNQVFTDTLSSKALLRDVDEPEEGASEGEPHVLMDDDSREASEESFEAVIDNEAPRTTRLRRAAQPTRYEVGKLQTRDSTKRLTLAQTVFTTWNLLTEYGTSWA